MHLAESVRLVSGSLIYMKLSAEAEIAGCCVMRGFGVSIMIEMLLKEVVQLHV